MKKLSSFVIAISMISAPLPALATHNLQPRPELTEEQKADDLMNKCLMWSLHPDMSYAGLEWHATYCDGHQFESATPPASNDTQTSTGQLMAYISLQRRDASNMVAAYPSITIQANAESAIAKTSDILLKH